MKLVVSEDESGHPLQGGVLGFHAASFHAQTAMHFVEQTQAHCRATNTGGFYRHGFGAIRHIYSFDR